MFFLFLVLSNLKHLKYKLQKILNNVKCRIWKTSWSKLYHTKSPSRKYCILKNKKLLKQCQKEQYLNIFWLLPDGSPFFGWRWLVVDVLWLVVDIFWLVVGSGGWCWLVVIIVLVVVGVGGWWWVVE